MNNKVREKDIYNSVLTIFESSTEKIRGKTTTRKITCRFMTSFQSFNVYEIKHETSSTST